MSTSSREVRLAASPAPGRSRWRSVLCAALTLAVLAGCGGGGGASPASSNPGGDGSNGTGSGGSGGSGASGSYQLQISPPNISVSAQTTDPAPTAMVQVSVVATSASGTGTNFYIAGNVTNNGIASTASSVSGSYDTVTLTFKSPASLSPGTYNDSLTIKACYDQACTRQVSNSPQTVPVSYVVSGAQPQVSSISPSSATAGAPAFTLSVSGTNFQPQSVVLWNNSARATTFVSATEVSAQISAADIAAAGTYSVSVNNQSTGVPTSNAATFTVQPLAALALSSISPSQVAAGGTSFILTAIGTGFTSTSSIVWNATSLPTTYVSSTMVRAQVSAALISSTGTVPVTVADSGLQGGATSAVTLTINSPTTDAVSYRMNPAHTGAVNFNSASLPNTDLWSVDVGGPASYALIVGGRVIVTAVVNGNSQLTALDSGTGAIVWGPIAFAGTANATYDAGSVYVTSGSGITSQVLTAIDASTGNSRWSASVTGEWFPAPPVAADGIVYTLTGGVLEAFDENHGAVLWQQNVSGTSGSPAASVDGIYASAPCTTYDLQPLVGTVVWTVNTGCEGGGGDSPVVSNGVVYSPINGEFQGTAYDSETGTVLGSFSSSQPPAVGQSVGFWLTNSTLQGIARNNNQVLWSFAGDGTLVAAPVVVNNWVFVGSSNGNLYAVDATTGSQIWTQSLGAAIPGTQDDSLSLYTGMAAGDGLLVVPSGTRVTAYLLSTDP